VTVGSLLIVMMRSIWAKETLDQTKVATCDASDRSDDGGIGLGVQGCVEAELHPLMLDHALELLPTQQPELVDEVRDRTSRPVSTCGRHLKLRVR
jgi:hypothetical protein